MTRPQTVTAKELAERIDGLARGRVIVFGSLPPEGRDLDLLAREPEFAAVAAWLREEGFLERAGAWVRFRNCAVDAIDLVHVSTLRLPPAEEDSLFESAPTLPGFARLVRSAPHHLLLMIARAVAEEGGRLSGKRRAKVDAALAEDPEAWSRARDRADAWSAAEALRSLQAAHGRAPLPEPSKAGRGHVVTFSGVDGSGKTSQIDALKTTLERLGHDVAEEYVRIEWVTLTENRALSRIAAPVKAAARALPRTRPGRGLPRAGGEPSTNADPAHTLRERSGVVTQLWVLVVALAHAGVQRRATRHHVRAGRVVICDRYTLDARVYFRYRYGHRRSFAFQAWLVRRLSPRPTRSYHLDVPAEAALARKAEQYGLRELTALTELYREECTRADVQMLDGERPKNELCAEIAADVWRAL